MTAAPCGQLFLFYSASFIKSELIFVASGMPTKKTTFLLIAFLRVTDRYKLTQALVVDPLYLQHSYSESAIDYRASHFIQ